MPGSGLEVVRWLGNTQAHMDDEVRAQDGLDMSQSGGLDSGLNVARHLALKRQKQELRRERDRLLLDLADGLGQTRAAQVLGVRPEEVARLLEGARKRVGATQPELPPQSGAEITVRRLRAPRKAALRAAVNQRVTSANQRTTSANPNLLQEGKRTSRITPPQPVAGTRGGRPEQGGERWADADSHYEALGSQALGNG
jgi:hypothetical protein